jgi:hypothetical protein
MVRIRFVIGDLLVRFGAIIAPLRQVFNSFPRVGPTQQVGGFRDWQTQSRPDPHRAAIAPLLSDEALTGVLSCAAIHPQTFFP